MILLVKSVRVFFYLMKFLRKSIVVFLIYFRNVVRKESSGVYMGVGSGLGRVFMV